jgi:membrane-associated HD superfamily phosphohydrolase
MTSLMIYLWTRLNVVNGFCIAGIAISVASFVVVALLVEDELDIIKKIIKKIIIAFCLFSILLILIPTKKDAAMIYIIPKISQSETFNTLSKETPEITKLALEALKETLLDITKKEKQ